MSDSDIAPTNIIIYGINSFIINLMIIKMKFLIR